MDTSGSGVALRLTPSYEREGFGLKMLIAQVAQTFGLNFDVLTFER